MKCCWLNVPKYSILACELPIGLSCHDYVEAAVYFSTQQLGPDIGEG